MKVYVLGYDRNDRLLANVIHDVENAADIGIAVCNVIRQGGRALVIPEGEIRYELTRMGNEETNRKA